MATYIPEEEELKRAELFLEKPKKDYCTFTYYGTLRRHDKVVTDVDLSDYVRKDLLAIIVTYGQNFDITTFDGITEALRTCVKLELIRDPLKITRYRDTSLKDFDNAFEVAHMLAIDLHIERYGDEEMRIETFDDYQNCIAKILEFFQIQYIIR